MVMPKPVKKKRRVKRYSFAKKVYGHGPMYPSRSER